MVHGICVAIMVSCAWILAQNLLMHIRPSENRFKVMLWGYLLSIPFVFAAYRWLPPLSAGIASSMQDENPFLGLFHAYLLHLLLFFCYVECFYHVERSVTLRMLLELRREGERGVPLFVLQERYSVKDMIQQRLEVMRDRGLVEQQNGLWRLQRKGKALAWGAMAGAWLFRAKHQHERA